MEEETKNKPREEVSIDKLHTLLAKLRYYAKIKKEIDQKLNQLS